MTDLHMIQLWFNTRELFALGKSLGLPMRNVDTNYLVHCALGELFQQNAPKPFALETTSDMSTKQVRVLGYSDIPADSLCEIAKSFASPMLWESCDWERMATKPMPSKFPTGIALGYEVRLCPVIRKSKSGKEIDAFLDKVWEVDDPDVEVDREEVYCDWLHRFFERRGGAQLQSAGLERFSLERVVRRTHGGDRKARTFKRPAATMKGVLKVTDDRAFLEILSRGIGRHKSFGFGMLKLRRAS